MYQKYALILVSLNPDMSDAGGNVYPTSGRIVCGKFKPNSKITSGLYGINGGLFTDNPYCSAAPNDPWVVVRIEINDDLIVISKEYNLVKFREGSVVYFGDLCGCAEYIQKHSRDGDTEMDITSASIAGTKILTSKHAFHDGYSGKAHTSGAGKHAIAAGSNSHAIADNHEAHAIASGLNARAVSIQDGSHAVALRESSRARCCGESSISVATGMNSVAISSGERGISAALAPNSKAAAGENGILIMTWTDDDALRVKVGYVGKDVEANILYRVENDEFIKCG